MSQNPVAHSYAQHSIVYAGRFADRVAGLEPVEDFQVVSEWEVRPSQLDALLRDRSLLIILDSLSFPFESMGEEHWETPVVAFIPEELGLEDLIQVFDHVLFKRLGFFDRVVVSDRRLWEQLQGRYFWGENQGMVVEHSDPEKVLEEILPLLGEEAPESTDFSGESYDSLPYWSTRGDELAESLPHRAICSVHHDLAFNKAMHRAQAGVLGEQFASMLPDEASQMRLDALEVGCGVGRWATSLDLERVRFTGVDVSESMVEAARDNFPECRFDHLGSDLTLPYDNESFDLAFTATVLHHNPPEDRRRLLSEMWRVTRPGGRLVFLEQFVTGKQTSTSTVFRMPFREFVALLLEVTGHQVVLEHVESLKYPRDNMRRSALISVSRLGVPQRL